jgi:hypothetical protein
MDFINILIREGFRVHEVVYRQLERGAEFEGKFRNFRRILKNFNRKT